MVPITHEQNIICSKTSLDGTLHEQTIICRKLFAGHVVGSRPMEGKKKTHRVIKIIVCLGCSVGTCKYFFSFQTNVNINLVHVIDVKARTQIFHSGV